MKALLLSNINMQPLIPFLRPWELTSGEFNSLILDLSNPVSLATSSSFSHILCLQDTDSMLGEAFFGGGVAEQCESYLEALEKFCAQNSGKVVIANTFYVSSARWLNFADLFHEMSLRRIEATMNERLLRAASTHSNLVLVDMELLFRQHGEKALLSNPFWYIGRIRYTNQMFRILGERIKQTVNAYANQSRKVLVLDLDNTLWGGIVGETGPLGINLSEEGQGRCYRDFQRALKALQRTGVLLAISSKNNPGDLDEVFDRNPMMVLQREDFACIRANWEPKPQNIAEIAEELNLGSDSLVFIDDNPTERELVAGAISGIVVPEFPARIEDLPAWFLQQVVPAHFGKVRITSEDAGKTGQYRANETRKKLSIGLDLETFLKDLKIECRVHIDSKEHAGRIAQMTQKTNQFNLTTKRYQIPEVERFIDSNEYGVVLLEYKDRFGYEGAVGLAIVEYHTCRIDTFLMSCRVIGRNVEGQILDAVYALFRSRGISKVRGEFIPSSKNQQTATFYGDHGFTLISEEGGRRVYEREI